MKILKHIYGVVFYLLGTLLLILFLSITLTHQSTSDTIMRSLLCVTYGYMLGTEFRFCVFNRAWISVFVPWLSFFGGLAF
jgi:hypothetical protein